MVENRMYQRKYTTLERFQGLPRDSVDSALPYGTDCTLGQNLQLWTPKCVGHGAAVSVINNQSVNKETVHTSPRQWWIGTKGVKSSPYRPDWRTQLSSIFSNNAWACRNCVKVGSLRSGGNKKRLRSNTTQIRCGIDRAKLCAESTHHLCSSQNTGNGSQTMLVSTMKGFKSSYPVYLQYSLYKHSCQY